MYKHIAIKNHHQEIQLTTHRSMIALIFICIAVMVLIVHLGYMQIYKKNVYATLSTKNWLDLVPVEPTRGLVYDRNGVLLADNVPVFSLDIIPFDVPNLKKTLNDLKKIITLSDDDSAQFLRQLKQHRRFDEIPLKLRLTDEEVAHFAENQHRFPGVMITARLMRRYPYGESFSHVIGNVGRINTKELDEIDAVNYSASHYIGKTGIEKYYEDDLHGKVGYQEVENDASGKPLRILKELKGTPGKNIYLTIDSELQFIAEKALAGRRGAVVVIQPSTGQVLAMVSRPGYDPNIFVQGVSQADYKALQQSKDQPLYDRALRGSYPLASTIKPYLALEGLDSEITTPEHTLFDPGYYELRNGSHIFRDWRRHGHGTVNISKAVTESCDTYFYDLADKMGIHRIDQILTSFGFGSATGIDLDDEALGLVASPDWKRKARGSHWYEGDTINSAIGQGYMQATPLQLAAAVSAIANRGQRFMPYLQLGEQIPGKQYVAQQPIPMESVTLKNPQTWNIVINAMQNVVASPYGTAYRFGQNLPYTIAAKTGTGQVVAGKSDPDEEDKQTDLDERFRDHHLFVAFAPVENPQIALAVITENSNTAIETARAIFDYYLTCIPEAQKHSDTPSIANRVDANTCKVISRDLANIPGTQENADRQSQIQTENPAT